MRAVTKYRWYRQTDGRPLLLLTSLFLLCLPAEHISVKFLSLFTLPFLLLLPSIPFRHHHSEAGIYSSKQTGDLSSSAESQ